MIEFTKKVLVNVSIAHRFLIKEPSLMAKCASEKILAHNELIDYFWLSVLASKKVFQSLVPFKIS